MMKVSTLIFMCTLLPTKGDNCTLSGICDCTMITDDTFEADCSFRYLFFIPKFNDNVIRIDMQSVGILNLTNTFNISKNVEYLYFSNTAFTKTRYDMFRNFSKLKILDLSSTGITLSGDLKGKTFEKQVLLTSLDLSHNNFYSLPAPIFKELKNLNWLDLTKNWLIDIDFNIGHLTNIKYMLLSYNTISVLSKKAQRSIETLNVSGYMNLNDNPLSCSCKSLNFLKWMLKNRDFFGKSFESNTCLFRERKQSFNTLEVIISNIDKDCQERHLTIPVVYIIIGVVLFVIILTVLGIVIFNKEWIKFKYYMFRVKHRIQQRKNGYAPLYEFDVFVSYAEEDQDFVFNTLQNELQARTISVCNHQLDFQPGKSIVENIVYSIEHSRVTVCVVSEHFFQSKHCKMEAEWAYSRSKEDDDTLHTLFPIFIGSEIPAKFLKTSSFRYVYKTTSVFELKTQEHEQRCFDKIASLVYEHRNLKH